MKKSFDLSLYLVLDFDLCGGAKGMIDTVRQAAPCGITMVQLRTPAEMKKRACLEIGLALKAALAPYRIPLIVNDHLDLALAIDADGVHVGQEDLPADVVRRLVGPNKIVGLSITQLGELASIPAGVDYLGVGPVCPTSTKTDAAPVISAQDLFTILQQKPLPTVLIGGISHKAVADFIRRGADGVAVVSAICGQKDIALATKTLAEAIKPKRTRS